MSKYIRIEFTAICMRELPEHVKVFQIAAE
jgi:hypothetical protein